MKKVGIITFHNSYNCGSMLESFAIQKMCVSLGFETYIINFSSVGQQELYSIFEKNNSLKGIIKNLLVLPHKKEIKLSNFMYENFKNRYFNLTKFTSDSKDLSDDGFDYIISGSDQIWNITIKDYDTAYFLPWVKKAKKIAYAPSFGARNILKYSSEPEEFKNYLLSYDNLSIRENNGKKWIKDLINADVPVVLDPTLLLSKNDYEVIIDSKCTPKEKYIFFYSPSFNRKMCKFVQKLAKKYNLNVITWSKKNYYIKMIKSFGFELPEYESPSVYLDLIKNAELVLTTSYHGTIFSTIFKKKFFTIKNGDMYGDDDRVLTLLSQISFMDRLIPFDFDDDFDYLKDIDYGVYNEVLDKLKDNSTKFLKNCLDINNEKI